MEIRPYTLKELAIIYRVDKKTLLNWLRPFKGEVGERKGRFYGIAQVEIIISKIGWPYRKEK